MIHGDELKYATKVGILTQCKAFLGLQTALAHILLDPSAGACLPIPHCGWLRDLPCRPLNLVHLE